MALGPRLLDALQHVHDMGIRHGDLHEGNILVTPEDGVLLLDFGNCELDAPDSALEDERYYVSHLLSMKPRVRRLSLALG